MTFNPMNPAEPIPATPQDRLDALSMTASGRSFDRRRFLQSAAAAGVLASGTAALAQSATSLEGYAQTSSVRAGQTLGFSVRNPAAGTAVTTAAFRIVRLAGWVDLTMQQGTVSLRNHTVPANAASNGCGWPVALSLPIPIDWPSGVYYAYFSVASDSWCCVPFVVRPAAGAAAQRVLVVVPVSTAQARNNFGGGSLDDVTSAGGQRLGRVSFLRPLAERWNYGFDPWQPLLARWLNRRGIKADFCTDLDLHDEASVLTGATLMVVAGHHAYWTNQARKAFDARVGSGLNVALLSGQNMCWQSRLEGTATTRVLVCHKDAVSDPETRPAFKTVRWAELAPAQPENTSIGLGSAGSLTWLRGDVRPATPFRVMRRHWVFEGTSLSPGVEFAGSLVGPFTDKAFQPTYGSPSYLPTQLPVDWVGPQPSVMMSSGALGSPVGATVLATANLNSWRANGAGVTAPFDQSSCEMMIFSRNNGAGTVFNAGTSDWVRGLEPELSGQAPNDVGRITANVMARLASGTHVESADVRDRFFDDSDGRLYRHIIGTSTWGYPTTTAVFRAFVAAVPGAAPVYRYRAAQPTSPDGYRYLLSLQADVGRGWTPDGIAFYAYATAQPGTQPIYQHHLVQSQAVPGGWRLQYTNFPPQGGYALDGIAFWAPTV